MAGRIITLQRQVRELGRLRAGMTATSKNGKTYPTSSRSWILTSANRDYLDAAAQLWGGQVEEWQPQGNGAKAWRVVTTTAAIDAILPPGDPLSQHLELWSRGGCQRRCNGEQEMLSDSPCLCRAEFGDDFHEQPQGKVCDIHTRLNLFLPDLPDLGVWRWEGKGFWSANHIAGYVDTIKGTVGPQVMVPVRLRIEPRTKVKDGQTSQFIEVVIELRGSASFGQIMAGEVPMIAAAPAAVAGEQRAALPPAPAAPAAPAGPTAVPDYRALANQAREADAVRALYKQANEAGHLDDPLIAHFAQRVRDLEPPADEPEEHEPADAAPVVDAETEPSREATWTAALAAAAAKGWSTGDTSRRFKEYMQKGPEDANGWEMAGFLEALQKGQIQ